MCHYKITTCKNRAKEDIPNKNVRALEGDIYCRPEELLHYKAESFYFIVGERGFDRGC